MENGMDLDDSLTNINWLGRFSCRGIVAEKKAQSKQKAVKPPAGVPMKRPQHSYSELIKLALSSAPDRRLALQQIYAWVEDNFPYYKYHANPGWRNSIRHSLSKQDMFIREAGGGGGRTSFWMMKKDAQPDGVPSPDQNKDASTETRSKKGSSDMGKRKLHPLLPRGVLPCLVPVPVLINPSAASPIAVHPSSCSAANNTTQRAIAPKQPIACCSIAALPSPAAVITSDSQQGGVVVKRWTAGCQKGRHQRRKQRHRVLQEPELPSQSFFSISTSNDSGLGSETPVSEPKTGSVMDNPSIFRTPVKRTCSGMVTSTPSTDPTLLSPCGALPMLGPDPTSPTTLGSFLDGSFFRSPESGVIGEEDLGLSPLGDTPSGNRHGSGSLADFSFLSFTPIRGISQKRDVCEPQACNEALPSVFPDFSLGGLERGAELVNISWSDFT